MGHYGYLFCFAKVSSEHVKDVESLIERECLIDDLNLEPKIGHCNIFANPYDLNIDTNKEYPQFLNDAIMVFNKLQCVWSFCSTDTTNVFYSSHFHTLIFQCCAKDYEPLFNFHQIANVLFDSYVIFTDYECECPSVTTKEIPPNKSLSEEYFNCDLETFLGQPDTNFYYTGEAFPVLPSYNPHNSLGAKRIQDKLNGYQPIDGTNCYVKPDGYVIVF